MDEATSNAIAAATTRLDQAQQVYRHIVEDAIPDDEEAAAEAMHSMLCAEAQAWASLAVAAAIAGSAPEMPSLGDIMSQLTGGASAD